MEEKKLYTEVDKNGSKIVKLEELSRAIELEIQNRRADYEIILVVGHLLQELSIDLDIVIVVGSRLKELIARLENRGYSKEKIRENIVSEAIDYCFVGAKERWEQTYSVMDEQEKEYVICYIKSVAEKNPIAKPNSYEHGRLEELVELANQDKSYGF